MPRSRLRNQATSKLSIPHNLRKMIANLRNFANALALEFATTHPISIDFWPRISLLQVHLMVSPNRIRHMVQNACQKLTKSTWLEITGYILLICADKVEKPTQIQQDNKSKHAIFISELIGQYTNVPDQEEDSAL